MNLRKGSYTVEAALTIPLLLFVFAFAMQLAVSFYQEGRIDEKGYYEDDTWIVKNFYRDEFVGGMIGEAKTDTF
ncbi:MAG: pilus assembly protein [Agathobacter sp.]|nr:pilus assembly protein [Agathobacter sp.]